MSAFIDLQNEIRKSPHLPAEDKSALLRLLAGTSEENVKTTNELVAFVCHSVCSEISSLAAKEERDSMTLSKWLSSTKVLGGGETISVLQGGVLIPLSSMRDAERKEALGSEGWCHVSQMPPAKMSFVWVRKD